MSLMLLGILNAQALGGGISYWLTSIGDTDNEDGFSVALDSSNNSYSVGGTDSIGQGGDDILLVKRDPEGAVQWQRILGGTNTDRANSVAIDSSDNVYALGISNSEGATGFLLAKYNSSGTIEWQRLLGGSASDVGKSVAIDGSDNIYVVGITSSEGPGSSSLLLAKYNISGTVQWQRVLGGSSSEDGSSINFDSSGNVYVFGQTNSEGSGLNDFLLAKYNSSGTIQWQRVFGGVASEVGESVAIDASDNIYVLGKTNLQATFGDGFLLAKYNSSGTIQWQRMLSSTDDDDPSSVALDSSGNVYVFGQTNSEGAGGDDFIVAKYDSSGTIQWQRVLGSSGSEIGSSIAIDSKDTLYLFGFTAGTGEGGNDFLLAKLSNDGSLTGTYELDGVDFVYAASTLTASTTTLTSSASTLTASTSTLTASTSTLTAASASLTSHLVEI